MSEERIVKVPMPIELIRRMDEAIVSRRGGFETRAEFLREAAENMLVELNFEEAPPEPVTDREPASRKPSAPWVEDGDDRSLLPLDIVDSLPPWELDELTVSDLAGTALRPPSTRGVALRHGIADPPDGPLLGLHNRDYPSLWSAHRLARYAHEGPRALDEFLKRVTAAAWVFASHLERNVVENNGLRLTALFPQNLTKRQAAERGFQNFAVGSVPKRPIGDRVKAGGPLFVWGVCQLLREGDGLEVGLTSEGWDLLDALEGLSLDLPHSPLLAERFLSHLAEHAPGDRWGFDRIVQVIASEPDRHSLVTEFGSDHPDWSAATASSTAQGYVARAREWGLVEPRLADHRYRLTDFGRSLHRAAAA